MVGSNEGHTVHVTCTIQYLLVPRLGTRTCVQVREYGSAIPVHVYYSSTGGMRLVHMRHMTRDYTRVQYTYRISGHSSIVSFRTIRTVCFKYIVS